MKKRKLFFILAGMLLAFTQLQASYYYYYVSPDGSGTGFTGTSKNPPDSPGSLSEALEHLKSYSLGYNDYINIFLQTGTYTPSDATRTDSEDVRSRTFKIANNTNSSMSVHLYGGFVDASYDGDSKDYSEGATTLSGDLGENGKAYHVIVSGENEISLVLDGLTIENGSATHESDPANQSGGGIYFTNNDDYSGSYLQITNSYLKNNHAAASGGALSAHANISITNSYLKNNHAAASGGALYLLNTGESWNTSHIEYVYFEGNEAGEKGGALSVHANISITDNTFYQNKAAEGGALYFDNVVQSFERNSFHKNSATAADGGGAVKGSVLDTDGQQQLSVSMNSFSDNSSSGNGGAIVFSGEGSLTLRGNTIVGNKGDSDSNIGGLFFTSGSTISMKYGGNIIGGNTGASIGGGNFDHTGSEGYNIISHMPEEKKTSTDISLESEEDMAFYLEGTVSDSDFTPTVSDTILYDAYSDSKFGREVYYVRPTSATLFVPSNVIRDTWYIQKDLFSNDDYYVPILSPGAVWKTLAPGLVQIDPGYIYPEDGDIDSDILFTAPEVQFNLTGNPASATNADGTSADFAIQWERSTNGITFLDLPGETNQELSFSESESGTFYYRRALYLTHEEAVTMRFYADIQVVSTITTLSGDYKIGKSPEADFRTLYEATAVYNKVGLSDDVRFIFVSDVEETSPSYINGFALGADRYSLTITSDDQGRWWVTGYLPNSYLLTLSSAKNVLIDGLVSATPENMEANRLVFCNYAASEMIPTLFRSSPGHAGTIRVQMEGAPPSYELLPGENIKFKDVAVYAGRAGSGIANAVIVDDKTVDISGCHLAYSVDGLWISEKCESGDVRNNVISNTSSAGIFLNTNVDKIDMEIIGNYITDINPIYGLSSLSPGANLRAQPGEEINKISRIEMVGGIVIQNEQYDKEYIEETIIPAGTVKIEGNRIEKLQVYYKEEIEKYYDPEYRPCYDEYMTSANGIITDYFPGTIICNANIVSEINTELPMVNGIRISAYESLITNNMVTKLEGNHVDGITVTGTDESEILHNTVYFSSKLNDADQVSCLRLGYRMQRFYSIEDDGTVSDVIIRNNLFINEIPDGADNNHLILKESHGSFGEIKDNRYRITHGVLGKDVTVYYDYYDNPNLERLPQEGTPYTSLTEWQGKYPLDTSPNTEEVSFENYLHLSGSSQTDMSLLTPLLDNVSADIDGDARSAYLNAAGADNHIDADCPPVVTWTGKIDTDWNTAGNWYPAKVPSSCSYVHIGEYWETVSNEGITQGEYPAVYPILDGMTEAICDTVHFHWQGEIGGVMYLTYNDAKVELELTSNRWIQVAPPLGSMFSGDYYLDQDATRLKPGNKVFMQQYQAKSPDMDGKQEAIAGDWSGAFRSLKEPLNPGLGYALWLAKDNDNDKGRFTLPKNDMSYNYRLSHEGEVLRTDVIPNRDHHARFIYESLSVEADNSFEQPVYGTQLSSGTLSTVLVPNPFMSHLDFYTFYQENTEKIKNQYYIWENGTFEATSVTASGIISTSPVAERHIAPLQSVVVTLKDDVNSISSLKLNNDMSVTVPAQTLRSIPIEEKLNIGIYDGGKRISGIVIHHKNGESNGYRSDKDVQTLYSKTSFGSDSQFSLLYAPVDGIATSIHTVGDLQQPIMIGLRSTDAEENQKRSLKFQGIENFAPGYSLVIRDLLTGEQQDLRRKSEFEFENKSGDITNRFVLFATNNQTGLENPATQDISITAGNGRIYISTGSGDELKSVEVISIQGEILHRKSALSDQTYSFEAPYAKSQIVLVKVISNQSVKTEKVKAK